MTAQTPAEQAAVEGAIKLLARIDRENAINCTGLGEVGCKGRSGWHSWADHRLHVAAAQYAALADAGLLHDPAAVDAAREQGRREGWDEGYEAAYYMARNWGHVDSWEDEPANPHDIEAEAGDQ